MGLESREDQVSSRRGVAALVILSILLAILLSILWPIPIPMWWVGVSPPLSTVTVITALWIVMPKSRRGMLRAASLMVGLGLLLYVPDFAPLPWLGEKGNLWIPFVGFLLMSAGALMGTIRFLKTTGGTRTK